MRPVKILTDSCADLDKTLRDQYDIAYARMNTVYEGKETPASLDWEYYSPKDFYAIMRAGNRILTTQVPAAEFLRLFTEYGEAGFDVVYIGCATKQSGSVNTAAVVAKELTEKHPEWKIFSIDSYNACLGEGMLAVRAAEYRDAGMSAAAIADRINAEKNDVNEFIAVHTLDALKRAGRVKASAAFFGNLLGVKPILISDANGTQTPVKKVKGRMNSLHEIVAMLKEVVVNPEQQRIYLAHADCEEEAKLLKEMVEKEIPCKEVYVTEIGPIIGASVGPDAIGIWGFGKTVEYQA